jgi:hypothetical protein
MSSSAKASRKPTERRCLHRRKRRASLRGVDVHIGESVAPAYRASVSTSAKGCRGEVHTHQGKRELPPKEVAVIQRGDEARSEASWRFPSNLAEVGSYPRTGVAVIHTRKCSKLAEDCYGAHGISLYYRNPRSGVGTWSCGAQPRGESSKRERFSSSPRCNAATPVGGRQYTVGMVDGHRPRKTHQGERELPPNGGYGNARDVLRALWR